MGALLIYHDVKPFSSPHKMANEATLAHLAAVPGLSVAYPLCVFATGLPPRAWTTMSARVKLARCSRM
jgi:hypothetical protein